MAFEGGLRKIEDFKNRLKDIIKSNKKEEAEKINMEMHLKGVEYAKKAIPWEEVQNMGLDNEPEFVKGYNETLEEINKGN